MQAAPIGETLDTSDSKKGKQLPPPSVIAEELAETIEISWRGNPSISYGGDTAQNMMEFGI
jgi:hypothetical protein